MKVWSLNRIIRQGHLRSEAAREHGGILTGIAQEHLALDTEQLRRPAGLMAQFGVGRTQTDMPHRIDTYLVTAHPM